VTTSVDPAVYRLRGYLGILAKKLRPEAQLDLQEKLTLQKKEWQTEDTTEVSAYHKSDGYFWIPRFFFENAITKRVLGGHDIQFEWTEGRPQSLPLNVVLDPARGQPMAVDRMEQHLRTYSGGILVAPTGCGKTILGFSIAQRFRTSIGVLVYNSHMVKNWIETATWLFGMQKEEIGLVQGDQCDLGRPVTIMMVQSLLERKYPDELYEQFGVIVADEVNRFGAPQWNEVMKQFTARYRLGLSADPKRDDGLDQLVQWHFGTIGHKVVMATPKPDVVQVLFKRRYPPTRYTNPWQRTPSGDPMPDSMKYDKLLHGDVARNVFIVDELVKMRAKGRRILIFSRFKAHLKLLKEMFEQRLQPLDCMVAALDGAPEEFTPLPETKITLLVGGLKDEKLDDAMSGDMIFTTFAFARDALNIPHVDTLVFGTPPGKPLQPIGRLRDKGPADRRSLLAIDPYEEGDYPERKANRRAGVYEDLGMKVTRVSRTPKD
jgi:hypothetical protein